MDRPDLLRPLFISQHVTPGPPPSMSEAVQRVLAHLVRQADKATAGDTLPWVSVAAVARGTGLSDDSVRQRLSEMTGCGWAMCARRVASGQRDLRMYRITDDGRKQAIDYGIG